MNLGTYFETPKHFPMMSGESWKPSCVHMPNWCWRKSGRRWPRGKSSPEACNAYNQLWLTYYRFRPQNEYERIWYTQSLTRLNQLGDQRRLRLLKQSIRWNTQRDVARTARRRRHYDSLQLSLRHEKHRSASPDDREPRNDHRAGSILALEIRVQIAGELRRECTRISRATSPRSGV